MVVAAVEAPSHVATSSPLPNKKRHSAHRITTEAVLSANSSPTTQLRPPLKRRAGATRTTLKACAKPQRNNKRRTHSKTLTWEQATKTTTTKTSHMELMTTPRATNSKTSTTKIRSSTTSKTKTSITKISNSTSSPLNSTRSLRVSLPRLRSSATRTL